MYQLKHLTIAALLSLGCSFVVDDDDAALDGLDESGNGDACSIVGDVCLCGGEPADPEDCGCAVSQKHGCFCDGEPHPPIVCDPGACVVEMIGGAERCACGHVPAAPEDCGCATQINSGCVCNGQPEDASACAGFDATCSIQGFGALPTCVCDDVPTSAAACGCELVGALCECDDGVYPPEVCWGP
jgi:hypothetical protein